MLNEGVEVEVVKYVPVQLSVEVKQVVADLVNKQKKSGLKVGRATKINYRWVYRYAKKIRDGDVVREKAGRPPVLDNIARDALLFLFQSGQEPVLSILHEKMKEERKKMLRRSNPNVTEQDLEKISRAR